MKRIFFLFVFLVPVTLFAQRAGEYKKYHDEGRKCVLQGEYQKGVAYFDTAASIMPYYALIYQDRAYAHMQLHNYQSALNDFDQALKMKPFLHDLYLQKGIAMFHLGRYLDARIQLQNFWAENPDNVMVNDYLRFTEQALMLQEKKREDELNKYQFEQERYRWERAREREQIIWDTVLPLTFWTVVFLSW